MTWTFKIGQVEAGSGADAIEPVPHDVRRILGGVEQDAAGIGHGEAAQAGRAGGDRDGEVEGEEGFAAFGLAADDADGFCRPQPGHQPALLLGPLGEAIGGCDGKRVHRRLPAATGVFWAATAQASKSSASSILWASRSAAAASSSSAIIMRLRRLPWA